MIKKIREFIQKHNLIPTESKLIVGLSGGPDSVFLLHLLCLLREEGKIKNIIAAHLDHEWRKESHKDVEFCQKIAKKYNTQLVTQKISNLGIELKFDGSKEEFGRNARRYFFGSVKKENKADLIALAHHAQDQQETFFIRLIRGSSLSGLTAIKPRHGDYVRPLLETDKKNIIAFLEKNKIDYLIDPSNESEEFLRNKIRKYVIPALQKCDNRFDKKFKSTINKLQKTELFLEQLTSKKFEAISSKKKGIFYLNIKQLFSFNDTLIYRILMHWLCKQNVKFPLSEGFLDEMIKFLKQPGSKEHKLHHSWYLARKKGIAHIKSTE